MWITTLRDIAIILLALESLIIGILLIILAVQIYKLVRFLKEEVEPVLDSAQKTAGTVQSTTSFLSETIVEPVIKVVSFASAAKQVVKILTKRRPR